MPYREQEPHVDLSNHGYATSPLVSVIIPTRNRVKSLGHCLSSLVQQTSPSKYYEVLIVDDHSSENVFQSYETLLDSLAGCTVRICLFKNAGIGTVHARNLGVRQARGEIIAFLDDDCIPAPNWISTLLNYFDVNPAVVAVTGRILPVELKHPLSAFRQNFYDRRYQKLLSPPSSQHIRDKFGFPITFGEDLCLTDSLAGGNSAVRSSTLRKLGAFDPNFTMMHDKELAIRLLREHFVCIFATDLLVRHDHTKSVPDAFSKSFCSGRMSYHLRRKHKELWMDSVVNPLKPFGSLIQSRHLFHALGYKSVFLVFTILALEWLHQIGFILESLKPDRIEYKNTGVVTDN